MTELCTKTNSVV